MNSRFRSSGSLFGPLQVAWATIALLTTFLAAWPNVNGFLDIRLAIVVAVTAGLFLGRSYLVISSVGLVVAYPLLGYSNEESLARGHLGGLVILGLLGVVETVGLYVAAQRTIASVGPKSPAVRILKFAVGLGIVSVVGGWSETLAMKLIDDTIVMPTISQCIGISVAAILAAIIVSRQGSRWFRYDKSLAAELLAPLVIVMMTLVAIEITRQVWERQDQDSLSFVAEVAQNGFLNSTAEQLSMLGVQVETATPFVVDDPERFEEQMQTLVLGQGVISIGALATLESPDEVVISEELTRFGARTVSSFGESAEAFDWTKDDAVEAREIRLLGIEDLTLENSVTGDTTTEPHLFFAVPIIDSSDIDSRQQFVVTAYSVPRILSAGTVALGGLLEQVAIEIDTTSNDTTGNDTGESLWIQGAPTSTGSRAASSDGLIGDARLRFTARPGSDFGVDIRSTILVLGIEIFFGVAMLAVLLQGANAQYRIFLERRRRELLLEAALDATPGKTVVFDESLKVLAANQEVRDEFPDSIPGLDVTRIFGLTPDSGRARLVVDALQLALDGEPSRAELGEDDSDSSMRILEIETYPIHGVATDRVGLLRATDSTERRNLAMRSAQSERMESLGALAGGLAHDFNNLLFVTLGNLQLMAMNETISNDEKLSKFVSRSMSAVERGAEITKSLLAVARSQPLEESAVTLSELVKGLLPLMRQALGAGRQVEVDIPDPNVQLMVDAGRLSSCILNLTFNSRDAMGPNGTLKISAHQVVETQTLELSVADDGKGMPADVVARAFEPFFTTKRAGSGTGLGLATVYAFAKQSGGTAFLRSRPGAGTTVTLSLPIHTAVERADVPVVQRRSGRRVVVADDEQSLAEMVASWLIDMGVDARFATSPKSALEMIEIFEPDVLVSDANFGEEMDGIELARLAVAIVPDLAVIFMTGYSASMKELQEQGERTLAKPFSREDLYGAISPLIAEARQSDEEIL